MSSLLLAPHSPLPLDLFEINIFAHAVRALAGRTGGGWHVVDAHLAGSRRRPGGPWGPLGSKRPAVRGSKRAALLLGLVHLLAHKTAQGRPHQVGQYVADEENESSRINQKDMREGRKLGIGPR